MELEKLQKSLRRWLMLIYGITAFVALFIVFSVVIFRKESSNGFEAFLNAIFDAVYQIMVIFFYLVFVFVSSTVGIIYGHVKKLEGGQTCIHPIHYCQSCRHYNPHDPVTVLIDESIFKKS